jgi:hypothetical protein
VPLIKIQKPKKRERDCCPFPAADGAVVLTVNMAVVEPFAFGVTEAGLIVQVGSRFMLGVTAQVRVTALLNPFTEATAMVDEAFFPGGTLAGLRMEEDNT